MNEKLFHQEGDILTEYTPEQYAQYALDQAEILANQQAVQAVLDARSSGIAHALSLDFTQAQAEAMFP